MPQVESLEQLPVKEPDLRRYITELEQAQVDAGAYLDRTERCRRWWECRWKGQTYDGKRHSLGEQEEVLPWDGASDSRLRIVHALIDQHVTFDKAAFWNAKLNCRSVRPLVNGRLDAVARKLLEWRIYTQMRAELNRELPFAFNWKWGLGLSFIAVEWEQQRTVSVVPLTIDMLAQLAQKMQAPELMDLGGGEEADNTIIGYLQSFSEILSVPDARKILNDLRNKGEGDLPVVNVTVNKPKWTSLLPCVDVLFPSETSNIQVERFVARRELATESDLTDRIVTDEYDPDFVDEAVKHKGEFSSFMTQTNWRYDATGSERDMIELHHFYHKNVEDGVPTTYRTVFNQAAANKGLYAVHRIFEYQHQQYPLVALRRSYRHRPLLSSMGIAEEAYTDEQDIKVQQDGLTDRCELIHNPPMVLPPLRSQGIGSSYGPRARMTALRPSDVYFPPLPPSDNTPMLIIEMVEKRLQDRYGIVGPDIDPVFKTMRQRENSNGTLGEMELVVEQTLQLEQQFCSDEDVQRVAGKAGMEWNVGIQDIQGKYEITVTYDPKLSDIEYVKELMGFYQQAMQFNQGGTAVMNKMFSRVLSIFDPDAEDLYEEDTQKVTDKERSEEKQAAAQILVGIEPDFPKQGNHQLRLQELIKNTIQSPNPAVKETIASRKDVQMLLKNRIKNHQNQIQQYLTNPQIGRQVSTQTFAPNQPAELTQ